jgi:hypothetical protein
MRRSRLRLGWDAAGRITEVGKFEAGSRTGTQLPRLVTRQVASLQLHRRRLAHIRQKARVRRAAFSEMHPRLAQTQLSVHREPDLGGILILLPVVFPPANRAQIQHRRRRQRPISATWTAILVPHVSMDGFWGREITNIRQSVPRKYCPPSLTLALKTAAPALY